MWTLMCTSTALIFLWGGRTPQPGGLTSDGGFCRSQEPGQQQKVEQVDEGEAVEPEEAGWREGTRGGGGQSRLDLAGLGLAERPGDGRGDA